MIKFFVSFALIMIGFLVLPFGFVGYFTYDDWFGLFGFFSMFLIGVGSIIIIVKLFMDNFGFENKNKKLYILSLISSALSIVSIIIYIIIFKCNSSSIIAAMYAANNLGEVALAILIICFSFLQTLSIYYHTLETIDTRKHRYIRTRYLDGVEMRQDYIYKSETRMTIFSVALLTAWLGVFSASLAMSIMMLGVNLFLLLNNKHKLSKIILSVLILLGLGSLLIFLKVENIITENAPILIGLEFYPMLLLLGASIICPNVRKGNIGNVGSLLLSLLFLGVGFGLSTFLGSII